MYGQWFVNVVAVALGVLVAWGIWRAAGPRKVFVVRVADGKARAAVGKVTPAFLERVREVATANEISSATVTGYSHGKFIRLGFSSEIGEGARQQLRNWWASFGWSAPRERTSQISR